MNTIHVIARHVGLETRTINFKDFKLDCPTFIGSHAIAFSGGVYYVDKLDERTSAFVAIWGFDDSYQLMIGNDVVSTELAKYDVDVSETELVKDLNHAIALRNVLNAVWDMFDKRKTAKIGSTIFKIWNEDDDFRMFGIGTDEDQGIFFRITKGATKVSIFRRHVHKTEVDREIKIVSVDQVLKDLLRFVNAYPIQSASSVSVALYIANKNDSKVAHTALIPKSAQQAFLIEFKDLANKYKNAK
jgi:hypothetical protein